MTIEEYVVKHWQHQSDRQLASLFNKSVLTIKRIRYKHNIMRPPNNQPPGGRKKKAKIDPAKWYTGTFNPHETEWCFSGLTQ